MRSVPYHRRRYPCQTEPRNSCQRSLRASSRVLPSQRCRTAQRAQSTNAFPVRKTKRRKAAIGTTVSITPPSVIAGISQTSANRFRKPPLRIRLPRQNRRRRMQKRQCNNRSRTPAPSCPRKRQSNRRTAVLKSLRRSATDAVRSEDHGAATPGAPTSRSLVASRWPDPYGAEPSTNLPPNKRDPGTGVNPASRTQPTSLLTAGQFAAADLSSQTPAYSLQVQLAALMGLLALAGIMATVIFKFGSSRQLQPGEIRKRRGPIWESTDDDRIVLSRHPGADGFAHGLDQAAERSERVAEFFAQISGRAPT